MILYHATYGCRVKAIEENGLLMDSPARCWSWGGDYSPEGAFGGCVFLAKDDDVAESFAETADNVPQEALESGIAVFAVDSRDLNEGLLRFDPFYHRDIDDEFEDPYCEYSSVLEQGECFAYLGDVPASVLTLVRICE